MKNRTRLKATSTMAARSSSSTFSTFPRARVNSAASSSSSWGSISSISSSRSISYSSPSRKSDLLEDQCRAGLDRLLGGRRLGLRLLGEHLGRVGQSRPPGGRAGGADQVVLGDPALGHRLADLGGGQRPFHLQAVAVKDVP